MCTAEKDTPQDVQVTRHAPAPGCTATLPSVKLRPDVSSSAVLSLPDPGERHASLQMLAKALRKDFHGASRAALMRSCRCGRDRHCKR